MMLCKVLGPVVATEKHPAFARLKLLVVQPLRDERQKDLPGPARSEVPSQAVRPGFFAHGSLSRVRATHLFRGRCVARTLRRRGRGT